MKTRKVLIPAHLYGTFLALMEPGYIGLDMNRAYWMTKNEIEMLEFLDKLYAKAEKDGDL